MNTMITLILILACAGFALSFWLINSAIEQRANHYEDYLKRKRSHAND